MENKPTIEELLAAVKEGSSKKDVRLRTTLMLIVTLKKWD